MLSYIWFSVYTSGKKTSNKDVPCWNHLLLYVGEHLFNDFFSDCICRLSIKKIKGSLKHSDAVTYVTFDTQEKRNSANITHLESFRYLNVVLMYHVFCAILLCHHMHIIFLEMQNLKMPGTLVYFTFSTTGFAKYCLSYWYI